MRRKYCLYVTPSNAEDLPSQSGGAIGLAIANSVLNNIFLENLPEGFTSTQQEALLDSLEAVTEYAPNVQEVIRDACKLFCND